MRERNRLASQMEGVQKLEQDVADAIELIELAEMDSDEDMAKEAHAALRSLAKEAKRREIESLLSGEADGNDAIWKSTPAPAARKPRTGRKCCCACTRAGPNSVATRWW